MSYIFKICILVISIIIVVEIVRQSLLEIYLILDDLSIVCKK